MCIWTDCEWPCAVGKTQLWWQALPVLPSRVRLTETELLRPGRATFPRKTILDADGQPGLRGVASQKLKTLQPGFQKSPAIAAREDDSYHVRPFFPAVTV